MDLYKEILIKVFEKEKIDVSFPNINIETGKIIENECYKALCK